MTQQQMPLAPNAPPWWSMAVAFEVWFSFIGGLVCTYLFAGWHMHPKEGGDEIRAIVAFSCVSAFGVGMSLIGVRYSKGFTKVIAFAAFALFAFVVLNLANELMHV